MNKIIVEIEWDYPEDPYWLNADNVALALHAYCKNTKFAVRELSFSGIDEEMQNVELIAKQRAELVTRLKASGTLKCEESQISLSNEEGEMTYWEVVIQANIVRWVRASSPEKAGECGKRLVRNENWVRPGTASVVMVVESDASEEFLSHHAVSAE